jgi:hypothetical protein
MADVGWVGLKGGALGSYLPTGRLMVSGGKILLPSAEISSKRVQKHTKLYTDSAKKVEEEKMER